MAAELVELLRAASFNYYNGKKLLMNDETYDGFIERLIQLDPNNPYFDEVGAIIIEGAVPLPFPTPSSA